ncbi:MAG: matrixin family metalloprotease [Planctomycetota bacterium]
MPYTIVTLVCVGILLPWALALQPGCGAGSSGSVSGSAPGGGSTDAGSNPADVPETDDPIASTVIGEGPFESYKTIALADDRTETLDGDIQTPQTVEVFDLGAVAVGDRLVITADAVDELDPVVGVFDANGDAMIVNDDRNYYGGDFDAALDVQSRRLTDHCYVAVAASDGSGTTGRYVLSLRRTPGGTLPEPQAQVIYLNFDGADAILIGRRPPVEIPVFEGSLIGAEFGDRTDELIEQTVAQIRRNYRGLNVEFVSSREGPEPTGPHTTLHFGAYDPGLLGLADYVDEFNQAVTQKAIIFVDTFQAFLPLDPSVEEMANALANVAAHEAGHLLGLNHTVDPREIMDITANLRQMLASEAFRRSPLHSEVFPAGYQDAAQLLVEAVGGDLAVVKAAAAEQLTLRAAWYDEGEPVAARMQVDRPFGTCFCPSCAKHRSSAGH